MKSLRDERVLVTGAAGFIGANLARRLLRDGARVHAIVRPSTSLWRLAEIVSELTLHCSDLIELGSLRRIVEEVRPEIIFHLAAQGIAHAERNRWETVRANVVGTANLLEATATLSYSRLIHLGGSSEYGVKKRPMKETDLAQPVTLYGASKAAASLLCQQVARADKRPIVVLRPFSVYGYWEPPTRLIPTAILAALRNRPIDLTAPGYRRDFVFVDDVVDACLLAASSAKAAGQTLNVGTGWQSSNEEVVGVVQDATRREVEVSIGSFPPRVSDTGSWVADIRKTRRLLGWQASHSLRSGIEKSVAWFRRHESAYSG